MGGAGGLTWAASVEFQCEFQCFVLGRAPLAAAAAAAEDDDDDDVGDDDDVIFALSVTRRRVIRSCYQNESTQLRRAK